MLRIGAVVVAIVAIVATASCGYDWTVIPNDGGKTPTKDGGGSTPGKTCKSTKDCGPDSYCVFPDGLCGLGVTGECTDIPTASSCSGETSENVCTCNGLVSKTRCDAASSGLDLAKDAACKYDLPKTFRCGFAICPLDTYCLELKDGNGSFDYRCVPFDCVEQTCSCQETRAKCPTAPCESVKGGGTIVHCGG